jgi:hypothetical protein
MITSLPILCLQKKFPSVIKNRLKKYDKSYFFNNIIKLNNLIHVHSQNFLNTIKPIIYYDKFWNDLFITNTDKLITNKKIKNNIKPYFIYFPQFHTIPENDKFYYPEFNDIKNLKLYNDSVDIKLDEPSIDYFENSDIENYNLTDKNIIQKQIDLIYDYGFEGLAIYYYWFSKNTITNKNQIMKGVFDIIFDENMINMKNRKIFFIWANENWTNNAAFGNTHNSQIINDYTEESFNKMSNDLIQYFQKPIYLKINNKPVLFIYHNFFMNPEQLNMFNKILEQMCINDGFNGVHIVINSFYQTDHTGYKEFYINFNYKKEDSRYWDSKTDQIYLDYKKYINNDYHDKDVIQTIVYDFNNKPRLFEPNHLKASTVCLNNTEFHKILFTDKLIKKYENKEEGIDKILLINALNEWGENMTFEPSNKYGFYNINLLTNELKKQEKMDFITITFNNNIDLDLLKIQALSFKYVDIELINKIIIIFNDDNELIGKFNNIFYNEVKQLYPIKYQKLIKVIYLKDLNLNFKESNWFTQQIVKLKIAMKVSTKYYIILDSKNHFIKNITVDDFFDTKTSKPILYYNMQGDSMLKYYNNTLDYFNVTCPNNKTIHPNYKIQTITPYLFITEYVIRLINNIEQKEQMSFETFFIKTNLYTEFYLYFSFLLYSNKENEYEYKLDLMPVLTIGPQDPKDVFYNSWEYKLNILKTSYINTMALHRHSIYILDAEYKSCLLQFYKTYFNDVELQYFQSFFQID